MQTFSAAIGVSQWVQLPTETRRQLVQVFNLKRSAGSEVVDGKLKTDGYTEKDLQGITVEKMQAFTGSESPTYFELLDKVLAKLEDKQADELVEAQKVQEAKLAERQQELQEKAVETLEKVTELVESTKRRGRPKK